MNPERRHSIRTRLYRIAYIQIEPGNGAIVVDLSEEGLSFQAVAAVHDSQQVCFWFSSPIKGRLKACGEVEWSDETKKRGGLRFLHLTEDAQQYVRELLAQPAVPAEPQLDSTPAVALEKATKKFTRITADQPRSHGQSAAKIPPVVINARESTTSPRYDERAPSQSRKPLPYTSAMLPRASLSELHEPEVVNGDLHERRAQAHRQKFRQGLLTGIAASVLALMGLLGFNSNYRRQIGDVLVLAGEELSSRNARASYTAAAPAVSTPNAPPSGPSTSANTVPAVQTGSLTPPDKTSATDLVSPSPEASTPAPATPPAGKPAASPLAPAKPVAEATQAADFGQYDLTMAEEYLSGSSVSRNSRTATQWLWAAVKKGNVSAEIALSDLYVAGEGVEKNCEQARILLQAAAEKDNATAAEKLRTIDKYGLCTRASGLVVP